MFQQERQSSLVWSSSWCSVCSAVLTPGWEHLHSGLWAFGWYQCKQNRPLHTAVPGSTNLSAVQEQSEKDHAHSHTGTETMTFANVSKTIVLMETSPQLTVYFSSAKTQKKTQSSFQLILNTTGCWLRSGFVHPTSRSTRRSHICWRHIWWLRCLVSPCLDSFQPSTQCIR